MHQYKTLVETGIRLLQEVMGLREDCRSSKKHNLGSAAALGKVDDPALQRCPVARAAERAEEKQGGQWPLEPQLGDAASGPRRGTPNRSDFPKVSQRKMA
jgi:hypothetical protein